MKTAMQELFSQLEIEHPNLFNTNTIDGRKFINDYYKFFELEKQNIIDSYQQGIKWQQERMYSEKEVLRIITELKSYLSFGDEFNEKEWFEKLKK